MTIEREDNQIELICDDCETVFCPPAADEDFDVLMGDSRAKGWRRFKRDDRWCDACPACVRDFAMSMRGMDV